jgi:hypothetical protein
MGIQIGNNTLYVPPTEQNQTQDGNINSNLNPNAGDGNLGVLNGDMPWESQTGNTSNTGTGNTNNSNVQGDTSADTKVTTSNQNTTQSNADSKSNNQNDTSITQDTSSSSGLNLDNQDTLSTDNKNLATGVTVGVVNGMNTDLPPGNTATTVVNTGVDFYNFADSVNNSQSDIVDSSGAILGKDTDFKPLINGANDVVQNFVPGTTGDVLNIATNANNFGTDLLDNDYTRTRDPDTGAVTIDGPATTEQKIDTGLDLVDSIGQVLPGDVGKYTSVANNGYDIFTELKNDDINVSGIVDVSSSTLGNVIGGEVGEKVINGGTVVQTSIDAINNGVQINPGVNSSAVSPAGIVGGTLAAADIVGIEVDPALKEAGMFAANLASGPVGWGAAAVQVINSIANMGGEHHYTDFVKNVDVSGGAVTPDEQLNDTVHIDQYTKTGFFNIGNYSDTRLTYGTTGADIDPNKIKDVEYSISPEANEDGTYTMEVIGNFDQVNPYTEGDSDHVKVQLSPEDAEKYRTDLGGSRGTVQGSDTEKFNTYFKPHTDGMELKFKQDKDNPTSYTYADFNGDGTKDLFGVSRKIEGMENQGDNSVSVSFMDENGNINGDTVTANGQTTIEGNQVELDDMLQKDPYLKSYAASNPGTWDTGTDTDGIYYGMKDSGELGKIDTIQDLHTAYQNPDLTQAQRDNIVKKYGELSSDLGMDFDPSAYLEANPDVKAAGVDPAQHYLEFGNREGRAIDAEGTVQDVWIDPALRDKTIVGSEMTNGELKVGETLVSNNGDYMATMQDDGNFVVYDISGTGDPRALWESETSAAGDEGRATSISVQGDGNIVAYNNDHDAQWASDTSNSDANRNFKMEMRDDGTVVVSDSQGGGVVWTSTNGGAAPGANNGNDPAFNTVENDRITPNGQTTIPAK